MCAAPLNVLENEQAKILGDFQKDQVTRRPEGGGGDRCSIRKEQEELENFQGLKEEMERTCEGNSGVTPGA